MVFIEISFDIYYYTVESLYILELLSSFPFNLSTYSKIILNILYSYRNGVNL